MFYVLSYVWQVDFGNVCYRVSADTDGDYIIPVNQQIYDVSKHLLDFL